MKTSKKRPLTKEELRECEKLNEIYQLKKSELKITQEYIASKMGISQPGVGHYLKGRNPLNLDAALKFSSLLKSPVKEFSPRIHKELVGAGLSDLSDKEIIDRIAGFSVNENNVEYNLPNLTVGRVPFIDWDSLLKLDEQHSYETSRIITTPYKHGPGSFCIEYQGDAMSEYREGEFVLIDPSITPSHNNDVLVKFEPKRAGIRKLQITAEGSYLLATNPIHPNRKIELENEEMILGTVSGTWQLRHPVTELL